MYLIETITNKQRMRNGFFPEFNEEYIEKADRLEIWGSSFKDDGGDYNVFKLMQGDTLISQITESGY